MGRTRVCSGGHRRNPSQLRGRLPSPRRAPLARRRARDGRLSPVGSAHPTSTETVGARVGGESSWVGRGTCSGVRLDDVGSAASAAPYRATVSRHGIAPRRTAPSRPQRAVPGAKRAVSNSAARSPVALKGGASRLQQISSPPILRLLKLDGRVETGRAGAKMAAAAAGGCLLHAAPAFDADRLKCWGHLRRLADSLT